MPIPGFPSGAFAGPSPNNLPPSVPPARPVPPAAARPVVIGGGVGNNPRGVVQPGTGARPAAPVTRPADASVEPIIGPATRGPQAAAQGERPQWTDSRPPQSPISPRKIRKRWLILGVVGVGVGVGVAYWALTRNGQSPHTGLEISHPTPVVALMDNALLPTASLGRDGNTFPNHPQVAKGTVVCASYASVDRANAADPAKNQSVIQILNADGTTSYGGNAPHMWDFAPAGSDACAAPMRRTGPVVRPNPAATLPNSRI